MKKTTSILCLLLAGALLLTGCKNKTHPQGNSTDHTGGTDNRAEIVNPYGSGSPNYDPSNPHGKKTVYGYGIGWLLDRGQFPINSWGNFYFQWNLAWELCFDPTGETATSIPCFDPLCNHFVDTCPAYYQFDSYMRKLPGDAVETEQRYPYYIFLDYYDNENSPVIYSVYRRSSVGHLGTENFDQEPYYLIQRYDLSSGERITLLSGIQELIHSAYTYGDSIYYTTSADYNASKKGDSTGAIYTLNILSKTGGKPKSLDSGDALSLDIVDITDDGVYYLVNSRYIYRCSLTLENPEMILDIDSVTDENGNHVQLSAIRNGYIFYFGDLSSVDSPFEGLFAGSCYRAPLNDPTGAVKIAENMLCQAVFLMFTDNYLYYMPAVMETVDNSRYPLNYSNGIVKSVNLFTGETVTACDIPGISFFTGFNDGDSITVYGQAYDESGVELGSGYKHIRLYPDGTPAEYWFDISRQGSDFVIGSWNE